ncbi:kinase-like domain-containing protein [Aspergillus coremiiformis]|uniref:Kinase-like domain-containing protein n=1 Tax=Aspergillus coremiiformis TaxID=138285 RepID=A0A5N6Z4G2_9EURO|nr:kinase-like domain-containing protein [Aspergillus coremiiformis]
MDFDDISLAAFEKKRWQWGCLCSQSAQGICALANFFRQRDDGMLVSMHCGSFNFSYRLHWEDDEEDWLIRFPLPGKSMFLDEKVCAEAVLMKYMADQTQIPVPRVIAYGMADDNPTGLGPFMIMTWIEGRTMSELLRTEHHDILNPEIDQQMLRTLYGQMARILLELWQLDFDRIGCLSHDAVSGEYQITQRALTLEMNEMIRIRGLTDGTTARVSETSAEYITSLLQLQSTHLAEQRNSIHDSVDCREKYTCRHLMKAIALRFISHKENHGPFKLFSEDFCPGNVLVNDALQVVGVIDWEFCYAAPAQFACSIPWWLLLQRPHSIINKVGGRAFLDAFLPKADLFLQTMAEAEEARGLGSTDDSLSVRMRKSIDDQSAWFILACRMVSSVDLIYWDLLDEHCWGPRSSIAERVHQFTNVAICADRENFVRHKINQLQEYCTELGVGTEVEYEEECFINEPWRFHGVHRPLQMSTRHHIFFASTVGVFVLVYAMNLVA